MELRRDVFQAIADPTRRSILEIMASQTLTAGAIANRFEVSRSSISRHIRILTECDLVTASQQGREIYYQLKIEKMDEVDEWLELVWNTWQAGDKT